MHHSLDGLDEWGKPCFTDLCPKFWKNFPFNKKLVGLESQQKEEPDDLRPFFLSLKVSVDDLLRREANRTRATCCTHRSRVFFPERLKSNRGDDVILGQVREFFNPPKKHAYTVALAWFCT